MLYWVAPPQKKQKSQNNDNLGDWLQGENGAILAQAMEEQPSPVCESENDVTLTSQDYGRGSVAYDVGELFVRDSPAEPSVSRCLERRDPSDS